MSDKIVNHFVLADGSVARYDYGELANLPFGDNVTEVSYKTRPGYLNTFGTIARAGTEEQEVYTNKLPCFPGDTLTYSFVWENNSTKWAAVGFYDENGRFISRSNPPFSGSLVSYSGTVTIPADVYYYSVSWRTYGNCAANFSYNGSVYDIRNRIDKGLSREELNGGFDTCHLATPSDTFSGDVTLYGNNYLTDFIPVTDASNINKVCVTTDNTFSYAYTIVFFDNEKQYISWTNYKTLHSFTESLPNNCKYIRFGFGDNAVIENIKQYFQYSFLATKEEPLTPIIGGYGFYPTFDTTENTLTIPYDCIFFKNGEPVIINIGGTSSGAATIDLSSASSSAKKVYYNINARQFEVYAYNASVEMETRVLVCVLRGNLANYPVSVSINSPYIINGKLYGIDTTTQVDFDAIAWAFNENVKGVNHRGYYTAPENTLPAYKLSKQVGFKYCETDVSMTSDRVPVLLHDGTINRTARNADGTEISETISIGSITYEQALQYDFGIYKGSQYAGTKIPTFEQFITLCRNLGLHPYIELKSAGGYSEAEVQNLVDIVKQNGMDGKVTWISFSSGLLAYVKNYDASARLGFIVDALTSANITTASSLKTTTNEVFLDVSSIADDLVDDCITAGLPVEVWTINSTSGITALNDYISGVTSDSLIASKVLYEENI